MTPGLTSSLWCPCPPALAHWHPAPDILICVGHNGLGYVMLSGSSWWDRQPLVCQVYEGVEQHGEHVPDNPQLPRQATLHHYQAMEMA